MSTKILNIIEDMKTDLRDNDYKEIMEALMLIKNEQNKNEKMLKEKDTTIRNMKNKIIRLVNRYMDLSLAFNNIVLEREGLLSDKFLFTDDCVGEDCIHSIIV